jgi:hypothetical protein
MFGQFLANGLRRGDVPMRCGGEEFLALLPGAHQAGLEATAERVRMLVENSWIQKGTDQVRVTVWIGATLARASETADDVVDRTDRFMYLSTRGGRNRIRTDAGELTSGAERPILGTTAPWETGPLLLGSIRLLVMPRPRRRSRPSDRGSRPG